METTRLSSKGQVIIPKSIRAPHCWKTGVRFAVEDTEGGVILRPLAFFPEIQVDEVIGCAGYKGPRRTVQEMESAIAGAREAGAETLATFDRQFVRHARDISPTKVKEI
jgi:AbrB family looped-hinge helix DNA binding protein